MAEDKQSPVPLTVAQAAKLVFRPPSKPDGKPVAINATEVLAFRDYGTHVVVVTEDGQKFSGEKATDKVAK